MVPAGNALRAETQARRALRVLATLLGKAPADQECVILTEDVPAFVRCDGPLYLKGPVWRIETTSAR
jgi:hypothetical protein